MKKTILIIEDNIHQFKELESILVQQDYEVSHADCGNAGLKMSAALSPQLILLDLLLPDMSGIEVCRRLSEKQPSLPIIFISFMNDIDDKKAAFQAGAVDYITKPLDSEEVVLRVRNHLALVQTRQELQGQLELVQGILNHIPQGLLLIENDLRCLPVNDWLERQTGEKLGKDRFSLYRIFTDDEVELISNVMKAAETDSTGSSFQLTLLTTDGIKLIISAELKRIESAGQPAALAFLSLPGRAGELKELEDYISGKMQDIVFRANEIMHRFNAEQEHQQPTDSQLTGYNLAELEIEIVQALLKGLPNKEIAFRLKRSESYIRKKISALYRKMGVHSRYELMRLLR